MRILHIFLLAFLIQTGAAAQTVDISASCISGTVVLNRTADQNGKIAYGNTGTVGGTPGTPITMYWIGAPDNVWVVEFDGQPYFSNSCNTALPPSTGSSSCAWTDLDPPVCTLSGFTISGTGTLPIQLFGFTASGTGQHVQLNWKTASETNNRGFEVQHSTDGQHWVKIGFVKGAVNSRAEKSYGYTHEAPAPGKNYYRLLQYDLDNRATASGIANADVADAGDYGLNSNLSSTGLYQLSIRSAGSVDVAVLDMQGKVLVRKQAARGVHQLDISKQPAGVYLLQLRKNNLTVTKKIIRE